MRVMWGPFTAALLVLTAGCGSDPMTWEKKLEHLKGVAERGADAHYVLKTEGKPINAETCKEHYQIGTGSTEPPSDRGSSWPATKEWKELSWAYFTDSCVAGKPRQIHTRPKDTPAAPPAPDTAPQPPASPVPPPAGG